MKWFGLYLVAALGVVPALVPAAEPPKPNIVVVLADDLGWTDAGFAGSRFYETPNLDALAAGGARFTSFYASSVGLPTRASLWSGQYPSRTSVYAGDVGEPPVPAPETVPPPAEGTSLAAVLKSVGYATGFVGTWGPGPDGGAGPARHGFDEAVIVSPRHLGFEVVPSAEIPAGAHHVDYVTDRGLEFMDRHREKPFLLVLSHFSVHLPTEPKTAWVGRFEKKPPAAGHRDAAYAAMIGGLDENVGRLVARLESLHLTDRTVVVFLSDNGGVAGPADPDNGGRRGGVTDNSPLRGGKGTVYEGGLRVPFLVRWPGVVPAGARSVHPVAAVDLFPTFCDIAGARPPAGLTLDGSNLLPLWRNPAGHLGRDALFWHYPDGIDLAGRPPVRTPPVGVVRAGNFKLVEWLEDGRLELYNVVEDLGEKNNLVRSLPDKAAELKAKLAAWRKESAARMPGPKPAPAAPPTPTSTPTPTPTPAPATSPATPPPAAATPPPAAAPAKPPATPEPTPAPPKTEA